MPDLATLPSNLIPSQHLSGAKPAYGRRDNGLNWAQWHAAQGRPVHPLWWIRPNGTCGCGRPTTKKHKPGKHPRLDGWPVEASTDPATIAAWWARYPDDGVGWVTGRRSGRIVGDLDTLEGVDAALGGHGHTPSREVATGRGLQYVYRYDGLTPMKNGNLDGWDIRATGGFVVGAGSWHENGRQYSEDDAVEADAPEWLLAAAYDDRPESERQVVDADGRRSLPMRIKRLLTDPRDAEQDDAVRHAEPRKYRRRHAAIRSIIMSAIQCGWQDQAVEDLLLERSTLGPAKTADQSNPRRWIQAEIARAHERIAAHPAEWVPSEYHALLADAMPAKEMSATKRKILWAHQEAARTSEGGIGKYSLSKRKAALAATCSLSSVTANTRILIRDGWLKVVGKPTRAGLQARYLLTVPDRYRQLYNELTTPTEPEGEGGQSATTAHPQVERVDGGGQRLTPLPTDLPASDDVFWWTARGRHYAFLRKLSTAVAQSLKALARDTGRSRTTIRSYRDRLVADGLVTVTDDGLLLVTDWEDRLEKLAADCGTAEKSAKLAEIYQRITKERRNDRRDYAITHHLPLKSKPAQPPEPTFTFRRGVPPDAEEQEAA